MFVYIIAWSAVVLGINSTRNAGSNFHEAKPSEISCITSASLIPQLTMLSYVNTIVSPVHSL